MRFRALCIGLVALLATGVAARAPSWRWMLPAGIEAPPMPADNPMSAAKVALGRRLFYDGRLSVGGTMSCATCHEQHHAFASATATHAGIGGDPGRRNVPGLANVAWLTGLTWTDPRIHTLEVQAETPMFGTHPIEMGGRPKEVIGRIAADACYRRMFEAADPTRCGTIDIPAITAAIAAFQRTLISFQAPYDAFRVGNRSALSPAALRGATTFAKQCVGCHSGANLTDSDFHAIAPADPLADDRGLLETTGLIIDDGRFRTPALRNVALTGPYLHDGSAATIDEAIRRHRSMADGLTPTDLDELTAFLGSMTDRKFVDDPSFSRPPLSCGKPL